MVLEEIQLRNIVVAIRQTVNLAEDLREMGMPELASEIMSTVEDLTAVYAEVLAGPVAVDPLTFDLERMDSLSAAIH